MTEENNTTPVTTEVIYTPVYAVKTDIDAMISFLKAAPKTDLMNASMKNADSTVNSRLVRYGLPICTSETSSEDIPGILKTAANYYAVSDILQSVYGKDDRSSNEEGFYQKAENLMNDYIQQQLDLLADTELKEKSPYGFSQSPDAYDLGLMHR